MPDERVSTEQILAVLRFADAGATWVARLPDELRSAFLVACNRRYIRAYTPIVRNAKKRARAAGQKPGRGHSDDPEFLWNASRAGRDEQLGAIERLETCDDPNERACLLMRATCWPRFERTKRGRDFMDKHTERADALNGEQLSAGSFTVASLREMTGLENTALNRYAKAAKVNTPRRGERNFRYTATDVRTILKTIIAKTSETKLLGKCQAALREL